MTPASSPRARCVILSVAALGFSACATGLPTVEPLDIPRIEQQIAASPDDTDLQVQLGMAQFKAESYEAARGTLQDAIDGGNESGPAFLYLGMVQEELEDWSAAREAYTRYLETGWSSEAVEEVRKRLTLIGRNLLREQTRRALAQETEITASATVTPRSVAVLPMAFNSDNADLEPLTYALSDMMVTDFKVSNALVVLERAQIQTLLDEMALTSAGYAEQGTGARAGRLLSAEHVFQGVLTTLGDDELRTDADILNVASSSSAGELTESGVLERLFDMEKQLVIRTIREVLGVELTPAEEQAILDNRRSNVLAFLAYGRGLREMDRGNYGAAQAEFQAAVQLEPTTFASAESALAETGALIDSEGSSTSDVAGVADATGETGRGAFGPASRNTTGALGIGSQPAGRANASTLNDVADAVDPTPTSGLIDLGSVGQGQDQTTQQTNDTVRDPVQEGTGEETVTGAGQTRIRIVIRRPGGGP